MADNVVPMPDRRPPESEGQRIWREALDKAREDLAGS